MKLTKPQCEPHHIYLKIELWMEPRLIAKILSEQWSREAGLDITSLQPEEYRPAIQEKIKKSSIAALNKIVRQTILDSGLEKYDLAFEDKSPAITFIETLFMQKIKAEN